MNQQHQNHCACCRSRSPWMNIDEAATYLRMSRATLYNLRWKGTAPTQRGRRGLYHIEDLDAWARQRSATSLTQKGVVA